jgi:hypothetical protein
MRVAKKVKISKNVVPSVVFTDILSSVFSRGEISFHKVNITEFVKSDSLRTKFSEHPVYMYLDKEKYVAKYLMDATTFEKKDLTLTVPLSGVNLTGKFTFMGEVSKFYIPAGLLYSIINNRVESAIPKEVINLIAEIHTPAVVIFDMSGGHSSSNKKFYVESLTYLFKENGKYLVVKPFNGMSYSATPQEKSTVLRFFEFLLNLTQFFNENEKVTPFCWDVVNPELLTDPILEEYRGHHPYDPAHEHGVRLIGAVNTVINEYVVNRINEAYTKARNSFNFLGLHPIEALEAFVMLLRFTE